MIDQNENILGFGDVFASGKSYENLLRGVIKLLSGGGIQSVIKWLVKKYGYDINKLPECLITRQDMQLHYEDYTTTDGEMASYVYVVRSFGRAKRTTEGDVIRRDIVYQVCTYDSDDHGFEGDYEVFTRTTIYALCRDGKRKMTSIGKILSDCQLWIMRTVQDVEFDRLPYYRRCR